MALTKPCPYCYNHINIAATTCPYCTKDLPITQHRYRTKKEKFVDFWKGFLTVCLLIVWIICLFIDIGMIINNGGLGWSHFLFQIIIPAVAIGVASRILASILSLPRCIRILICFAACLVVGFIIMGLGQNLDEIYLPAKIYSLSFLIVVGDLLNPE